MRAFSDGDLVQANTGTATASSSVTVTVPAGTAEGNAGLVIIHTGGALTSPESWDRIVVESTTLFAMCLRAGLPAGESSWGFASAGGANWAWTAGEWGNMAPAPVQSTASAVGAGADPSLSTGSTGTFDARFVMGVAAFSITNGSASASGWPAVSYDSSFTETDSVQTGPGTGVNDVLVKVARRYGTDSETGPWSCTATFTGPMANKTPRALLAVFRAEETADPPILITS